MRSPTTVMPSTLTQLTGEQMTDFIEWSGRPGRQPSNTLLSSWINSGVVPQQPPAANRFSSR